MSFLRTRRKVLRPVVNLKVSPVERLVPVEVNGRKFTNERARLEYERRKAISDAETEHYLRTQGVLSVDGREHLVKHGPKRNAKFKPAVQVRSSHLANPPDTVPDGFEDRSYEWSGDTVRPVPTTSLNDRRWMGGTGKKQGNPFWSADMDRKLRKGK